MLRFIVLKICGKQSKLQCNMENVVEILSGMGITGKILSFSPFTHEDGEGKYDVWCIEFPERRCVLKRVKPAEAECYNQYLLHAIFAPRLIANREPYLLLEYVEGHNLMRCRRSDLIRVLNSMIIMQCAHWDEPKTHTALEGRKRRKQYLNNGLLERAYDAYLADCNQIPWTLCHDDLLPFNTIVNDEIAVLIDWEHAGILPYAASLARLIAHTEQREDALFYMSAEDQAFAIEYYYEKLLKPRGILYDSYRRTLDLHLFHEYCEWVYVGNKFGNTAGELFRKYSVLAINMAKKLGFNPL